MAGWTGVTGSEGAWRERCSSLQGRLSGSCTAPAAGWQQLFSARRASSNKAAGGGVLPRTVWGAGNAAAGTASGGV